MLLTAEREGHVCISDIALRAGFSDISHFNTLFRTRFGDTPSGLRAQAEGRARDDKSAGSAPWRSQRQKLSGRRGKKAPVVGCRGLVRFFALR